MCTVTVLRAGDRLLVTMNRDERRTRADELPPRTAGGGAAPRWIGPADGDKGGTWFGANDRGMVACLLNAYEPGDVALFGRADVPSRGGIIPELLSLEPERAWRWLHSEFDPSPYPSFTLIVATVDAAGRFTWRLDAAHEIEPVSEGWTMDTSSFFMADTVLPWRQRMFNSWLESGAEEIHGVPAFNLLEVAGRREWSPLMTRPYSTTRSLTQAEIRPIDGTIQLRYWRRAGEAAVDPARPTAVLELPIAATPVTP
jgi:uncharacterized protein with NRDE domain